MEHPDWPPTLAYLLQWTQSRAPDRSAMQQRFTALLALQAQPLPAIIKITGTNGKGSVCAMLEASLLAAGKSVAMFTSPHLTRVTERLRINGVEISTTAMEQHAQALRNQLEPWVAQHGLTYLPSFFEILILIALRACQHAGVEVAIFEAGIGGSNDAVSLLPGQLAAITSVGIDHADILGHTLAAIALDKSGIASDNTPLLLSPSLTPDLLAVIRTRAAQHGNQLIQCQRESIQVLQHTLAGIEFTYSESPDSMRSFNGCLNLPGQHQVDNLALVLKLLSLLQQQNLIADFKQACQGLHQVNWPCRLNPIAHNPRWLLDVAHNAHGMHALIASLAVLLPFEQRILLWGSAQDKDYPAYLERLPQLAGKIYLVEGFNRAASSATLAAVLPKTARLCGSFASVDSACASLNAQFKDSGNTIIVAGSVFLAGAVLQQLQPAWATKPALP
ncbi:MAG: hypothetical protein RL748_4073 [Pseudomonadota bacterium]